MRYEQILTGKVALPDRMQCSLEEFAHRIAVAIDKEQLQLLPNNALIALLCDAARLGWEHIEVLEARKVSN